ncbi:MAG TPA: SDR family oxidoreductase [Chloroflexota bacterium]|nr:SDR family oxidoreductase [Chloroflexota bacterium]
MTGATGPDGGTGAFLRQLFDLSGQVAVVTGGTGVLGGEMARGLARAGARVGVLGRQVARGEAVVAAIAAEGGEGLALGADVTDERQLVEARERVLERWGKVDILVNAAGGNMPEATVPEGGTVFDLELAAFADVLELNLTGTVRASLVFGQAMVRADHERRPQGVIVNISSMTAQRAVTRVVGYGAAKAAVDNFTRWLAAELARTYGEGLRVNAIAPGFFIGEQNRSLLLDSQGQLTERGRTIVAHTPAGRFGEPRELLSTLVWLCAPGSSFVNGVVVPVDGGFSAFSGV